MADEMQLSRDHPAPQALSILRLIVDPDPTIGVVSVVVTRPEYREFERMPGESVEDLERRAHEAMRWG